MTSIPGYIDYRKREFCNDVNCQIQQDLNRLSEGTQEYERLREICKSKCKYTTWQFHHWLLEKGYLIVRPEKKDH